jgi:hypothetical protein
MRKITTAALAALALCLIFGAGSALAGDGCNKCNDCKQTCGSSCKKACKTSCNTCAKPSCGGCAKSSCNSCAKPSCGGCKKSSCNSCAKPSCGGCGKCNSCKPKCSPCKTGCGGCKSKCKQECWGGGGSWWKGDPCCPKTQGVKTICLDSCNSCGGGGCGDCSGKPHHAYENCWNGSSYLCDTGACGTFQPCKRKCVTCETVCKEVEVKDCNGCARTELRYETVCHELKRPTVIPWWFNEKGAGNIYVEDKAEGEHKADSGEVADTTTADSGWSSDSKS